MDGNEPQHDNLINADAAAYGQQFQDHLLEQYKLFVESSLKVSEKRISTGNYLLAVNSSLLTVFGIASTLHVTGLWLLLIPITGTLVCATWFSLVASYKNLNSVKFKIIHELESQLPAALFRYEWHVCERGRGKAYTPITQLERWIPLAFIGLYLGLGLYTWRAGSSTQAERQAVSVTGTVDVNIKSIPSIVQTPHSTEQQGRSQTSTLSPPAATRKAGKR